VVCLRKKLENTQRELSMNTPRMTSIEQLDKILNAQRSPLIKIKIGYEGENSKSKVEDNKNITFVKVVIKENDNSQQSEIIVARRLVEERRRLCKHLRDDITSMENSEKENIEKYDEATQKRSKELEANKTLMGNEVNRNKQQPQMTKNEMKKQSAEKGSYNPENELNKFGSCQKRFFPPMRNINCFVCHKPGHIAAYCKTNQIQSNQQRMQKMKILPQANKWRGQPSTRYTNLFDGYCFCCKGFGHKAMQC